MSNEIRTSASSDPAAITSRSENRIFTAVTDRRRRYALTLLCERGRPVSEEDLATQIAARERDKPLCEVVDEERRAALASLHHVHLSKLEDAGLIDRDSGGNVTVTDRSVLGSLGLADVIENDGRVREETLDRLFDVLSNQRRRNILVILDDQRDDAFPLSVDDLAEAVVEYEKAATGDDISEEEYERIGISLRHQHLPKLADADVITYDRDRATIAYEGHPALRDERV